MDKIIIKTEKDEYLLHDYVYFFAKPEKPYTIEDLLNDCPEIKQNSAIIMRNHKNSQFLTDLKDVV